MKFPSYDGYPQPAVPLLDTYARSIGVIETRARAALRGNEESNTHDVALEIGSACMKILHGNSRAASRTFSDIAHETAAYVEKAEDPRAQEIRHYHRIAKMLAHGDDEVVVREQRQAMHTELIEEINLTWQGCKSFWEMAFDYFDGDWPGNGDYLLGNVVGHVADATATGLLTRLAHPWMIATRSLVHHDGNWVGFKGRGPQHNYDTLLVETGPYQTSNTAHQVQTKLACIGLCDEPDEKRNYRRQYTSAIQLVSGHCDLEMRQDDTCEWHSPLTDLLIKEAEETATPEEIERLDGATGRLLLALTAGNKNRRGIRRV